MPIDPVWEAIFVENEWGKYPAEQLIRFIAQNFYKMPDRKKIKILELGCGPGANLWFVAREGFSAYGIDGSPTAVERANARLNKEVPGWSGKIEVGDMRNLPYNDEEFDCVIDNEACCTQQFDETKKIYKEANRVTKKGGKLYVRTFATGCVGDGTGKKLGHNAWEVTEGGLANKGLARFTDENEISEMISPYKVKEINLLTYSDGGYKNGNTIKEWIVIGQK